MQGTDRQDLPEALQGLDDEELEEALETMGPGDLRVAPDGRYRVLGTDMWTPPTDPDWVVGDFDSKGDTLEVAREKNKEAAGGQVLERGHEKLRMINRYFVYDDEGNYFGGDIHAGE